MGRPLRAAAGGWVYHVLNRANARLPIFESDGDYEAFERILAEGVERFRPRLIAYCLMPNHWHLVAWPEKDGVLSRFVGWVTLTHTQRHHAHRHTVGTGHLYQGRFKSFPVQQDEHFYAVCRYVERNALRAGLAERPDDWRYSSLWRRTHGDAEAQAWLSAWPVSRPGGRLKIVRKPQTEGELSALRRSIARGSALRRAPLDQAGRRRTRARVDAAAPRQAEKRFLTPLLPLYAVCRYVERNALRAGLVERPDDWRYSSLWRRTHGDAEAQAWLSAWPVSRPGDRLKIVRKPQTEGELSALRRSIARGVPFGGPRWTKRAVAELGLESTLRPRGRPKKGS